MSQVIRNKAAGDLFRDMVTLEYLNKGTNVEIGQSLWTPYGLRRQDILVEEAGKLWGVRHKVGNSRYLASQRLKDASQKAVEGIEVTLKRDPQVVGRASTFSKGVSKLGGANMLTSATAPFFEVGTSIDMARQEVDADANLSTRQIFAYGLAGAFNAANFGIARNTMRIPTIFMGEEQANSANKWINQNINAAACLTSTRQRRSERLWCNEGAYRYQVDHTLYQLISERGGAESNEVSSS